MCPRATRSVEQGVAVGMTVTFRQRDSDSMGPPLQIHVGTARDTAIDAAPDPEQVSIGTTSALFPERVGGGVDARGSVVVGPGDVDLAHLVAIASSVLGAAR
jgi:hypothetical protein